MLKPNACRSPGYVTNALYFNLRVLALHLVRLVVELREDGGEARVGGRPVRVLGRELERAKRLVAPDLELRDPRREPACAVRARCVRGACAVRARDRRATCGRWRVSVCERRPPPPPSARRCPPREVKSTSHRSGPPPGVQHVPSFQLVIGAALVGLEVESIRRNMSPRQAALRPNQKAGRGG